MAEHTFGVWAPHAQRVELVLGADAASRVDLRRTDDGWWTGAAEPGDGRYAFAVDDGDPRPDPRSLSQPDGVHAMSELLDVGAHAWSDGDWAGRELAGSVIYELHVGTFSPAGTFDGVIEHLDHLVDLGVDVLELMPVAAFPGEAGWGYDGVALYAVHAGYGGLAGLQRLVDACHQRGLAVYLDVVYNHLGPSGNYLAELGPYFTDRHHTPWGEAVNLDGAGSDQVRAWILDNARMWLQDVHLDGLRLDAVHELHDERALHLLEELATLADEVSERTGIPRTLVAESDRNDPATVSQRGPGGAGGLGLQAQWADDVHHALHAALTGEAQGYYGDFSDPDALPKVLATTPFFHDGTYSTFRGRVHGRPVEAGRTPGWRYVASLQTHDQVGNRAPGDRLVHLVGPDLAAVGAALLLTSPYTPMLFMGEEWGASTPWQYFTDHAEEWLAESIRQGRGAEFAEHGWGGVVPDPQDPETVRASRLDWSELESQPHAALLGWHQALLRLRRERPELRATPLGAGDVQRHGAALLVTRGAMLVGANLGDQRAAVPAPGAGASAIRAQWGEAEVVESTVTLGSRAVVILERPDDE